METLINRNGRKRRTFFSTVKPVKNQNSLFIAEKSKAIFYGDFYKKVLQSSEKFADAVNCLRERIATVKKRILFFESLQFSKEGSENKVFCPVESVPFYDQMDCFWAGKKFMPIYDLKEMKRKRILNILSNEENELLYDLHTLIQRCTL